VAILLLSIVFLFILFHCFFSSSRRLFVYLNFFWAHCSVGRSVGDSGGFHFHFLFISLGLGRNLMFATCNHFVPFSVSARALFIGYLYFSPLFLYVFFIFIFLSGECLSLFPFSCHWGLLLHFLLLTFLIRPWSLINLFLAFLLSFRPVLATRRVLSEDGMGRAGDQPRAGCVANVKG